MDILFSSSLLVTSGLCVVRDNVDKDGLLSVPFDIFVGVAVILESTSVGLVLEDFERDFTESSDSATSEPPTDSSSDAESLSYSEPISEADPALSSVFVGDAGLEGAPELAELSLDMYWAGDLDLVISRGLDVAATFSSATFTSSREKGNGRIVFGA